MGVWAHLGTHSCASAGLKDSRPVVPVSLLGRGTAWAFGLQLAQAAVSLEAPELELYFDWMLSFCRQVDRLATWAGGHKVGKGPPSSLSAFPAPRNPWGWKIHDPPATRVPQEHPCARRTSPPPERVPPGRGFLPPRSWCPLASFSPWLPAEGGRALKNILAAISSPASAQ